MDAFSVSIADGLKNPNMRKYKMISIAICFAFFQFIMPLIGWLCVHTIVEKFNIFRYFISLSSYIIFSAISIFSKFIILSVK